MQALSQDRNMWTQKDKKRGEERGEAAGKIKIHRIMKKGWQEEGRSEKKKGKERERVREEERKERKDRGNDAKCKTRKKENCTHPLYPWTSTVKP